MKGKKFILLFIALLLPACIFVFLKFFGKNEFVVPALYTDTPPLIQTGCSAVNLPYIVADTVINKLPFGQDSLLLIRFGEVTLEEASQLNRVDDEFPGNSIRRITFGDDREQMRKCIFFLKKPFNLVLVDRKGRIRGQYVNSDREEMDRLLTELAVILKKY